MAIRIGRIAEGTGRSGSAGSCSFHGGPRIGRIISFVLIFPWQTGQTVTSNPVILKSDSCHVSSLGSSGITPKRRRHVSRFAQRFYHIRKEDFSGVVGFLLRMFHLNYSLIINDHGIFHFEAKRYAPVTEHLGTSSVTHKVTWAKSLVSLQNILTFSATFRYCVSLCTG
jgi:hypothetical protein